MAVALRALSIREFQSLRLAALSLTRVKAPFCHVGCRLGLARQLAQYLLIRMETSWRSAGPMDLRPRRLTGRENVALKPLSLCTSKR